MGQTQDMVGLDSLMGPKPPFLIATSQYIYALKTKVNRSFLYVGVGSRKKNDAVHRKSIIELQKCVKKNITKLN